MMNGIAATAMSLSAAKLSVDYSTAVTKKAMDSQEAAVGDAAGATADG